MVSRMKKFFPIRKLRKIPPVYPLLLGVIFPLAVYFSNSEIVPFNDILPWIVLVVLGTCLLWLVCRLVFKSWDKSALIVGVLLVGVFAYGHIHGLIGWDGRGLLPIWILLFGAAILLVVVEVKAGKVLRTFSIVSSITSACIVIALGIGIGVSGNFWIEETHHETSLESSSVSSGLDVYLIVPDEYPGWVTLSEGFGYDNSGFIKELESRGFYVVENSYSNYPSTTLSLASFLNMKYLDMSGNIVTDPIDYFDYEVWHVLDSESYEFVHIGSLWGGTSGNYRADVDINSNPYCSFGWVLYKSTIFYPPGPYTDRFNLGVDRWREVTLSQYEHLVEVPGMSGPTYTFMHTLGFHPPFVLGQEAGLTYQEKALAQLEATNDLLLNSVDRILANSSEPPIIVIKSDTGPYSTEIPGWTSVINHRFDEVTEDNIDFIRARLDNFQALYLPGFPEDRYSEFSSSVNTFSIILNYYFGTEYEILPNRHYFIVDWDENPMALIDVTEVVEGSE